MTVEEQIEEFGDELIELRGSVEFEENDELFPPLKMYKGFVCTDKIAKEIEEVIEAVTVEHT